MYTELSKQQLISLADNELRSSDSGLHCGHVRAYFEELYGEPVHDLDEQS